MNGNQTATLPSDHDYTERFPFSSGVSLLCYRYPHLQYDDCTIRTLFLMRATIEDGNFCPDPDGYLKVNSALLQDQGVKPLQIQGLAHNLADPAIPFAENPASIAKHLSLAVDRFDPINLDEVMAPAALGRMQ